MKKSSNINSCILYLFLYAPLGAVCPLISQYLASIGFSGTQVGLITSLSTAAAVLGGIVMGNIFANVNSKRLIIILSLAISAVGAVVSMNAKGFLAFAIVYSILYFFQQPVQGFCDSIVIENGKNYALVRSFGAIGYAASSYFAGLLSNNRGLQMIFVIHAISSVIACVMVKFEKEPPKYTEKKEKVNTLLLFKDKGFVKLLICAFFMLGPVMGNNTYFGYLYRSAGGDVAGIGFCFMLMAGSEAVVMVLLPLAKKRLSTQKLMIIGMLVAIVRFGIFATGPSVGVLIGTFFLQGIMDGILLVEFVNSFGRIVEPKMANISVSTYYAIGFNFSSIVTNAVSGVILDAFSAKAVYLLFSIMCLIAFILYICTGLVKEKLDYK